MDDDCDGQTDENLPQHPDYAALMALYNATDGANWTNHTGWGTTSCDVCGWHAVNCTDGRVTQLYLDSHNLVGALPAEIGNLTALRYIGMQNNHLSGPIPTTIGNLVNLSGLDLNSNQLSGTIPASIGNIPTLLGLGLSNNLLTGSLPPELSNLTNLVSFGLYNNQLSGCIPASYSAFCTSGTGVYIGANAGLPGGGDFAAFCANGTGQCPTDMDGDGYSTPDDCDDTNDDIYPGATEICNGADDDCDGQTDEGFPQTWTGATSTDWNIGSNWCSGHVPLATEDVIIPDVTNDPVIMGGTAAVAQSVTVNVGGLLTVTATGSLTINGSTAQGILNQGTVENGGLIVIGSTLSVGVLGIWNQGTFNNNTGSEIRIDRSTGWGVYNDSGIFTNFAKISIGSTSSVGYDGIRNQGTFHNNAGGEIRIGRSTSRGLYNSLGTFTNSAKIIIGAVASVGNYGVDNDAVFNNNADGEINIDRTSSAGLRNYFSTFNNAGEITIGAVASVGTNGVENRATFNNNTGGDISIERSSSSGLYNYLGTFTNSAKITIGAVASVGNYGLNNQGTFNNNTEGNISIDRSSVWGLLNILGTFDNNACATILLIGRLYNQQATFTNSGLFTVNTAQGHQNSAPLTNNGILSYPQGNPIPNVTNNDLVAAPITGAAVIANALQKGGALSFTAAGTWYSDPLLTTLAGSYNQAANTFTPVNSLPQCTNNTLYFNVTDAVNGCTRVASIRVNYDATAPMLTCPANRTVNLNTNCQASLANYTSLATVSDNCTAVASIARAQSPGTGNTVSGVGITVMTITATDMVGNSATCVFNVTHADVILPSIACPTTQTLQLGASCTGNLPNYASMATAADNCTPVASITKTQVTPLPGTVVTGVGLTTVTLRATDASGRSRTCNFSVQRLCGTGPETPSTAQVRADHLGEALSALAFDLEMFPNPTEGLVRLVLHGELKGESEVTVFDAMGRSVWRKRLSTEHNAATLDLSEEQYMAGLYFVVVRSNGATLTKRLVKAY